MLSSGTLNQLSVFVRIIETGSFTKAAKELGLSRSAVSKSLSKLEEQLGKILIRRTTRNIFLTEHGEAVFNRAILLLQECEDMFTQVRSFSEPEGHLRLSCSVAYGSKVLPEYIMSYQTKFPQVKFHVDLNDNIINLSETNFDMVLRITKKLNESDSHIYLGMINWIYCCSPQYLKGKPQIQIPGDLTHHRCITNPVMAYHDNWIFSGANGEVLVPVDSVITSNSSLTLLNVLLNHQGVSCLPDYLATAYIKAGTLVHILPDYHSGLSHYLYAIEKQSRYINPLTRTFIEHLKQELD
ncbi:LysR family transcriptional regulator [Enterobacter sp. 04-C-01-SI_S15]|uniref:LysR family transcriptional regulator n=1 Tax=Enterobacteriaceae TaxID=543 RepID=UPI0017488D42|nr:LysR family transcriptional regulator [Citrobacter freundii]HBM9967991.1 LysR family transcriptional regulator [Enterobacter chengduensis]MBD5594301.1 LysR family transcriptional regulator [Citrobacter freundii]HBH6881778.1 LysR family transcriptional regulator [Citrobacter freundii]HBH6984911.1 LysR family transcriptional regulator [Citrobacter freundii]HBN0078405.1 LysR family transcriptional regulator [Enterobacter chengduensis]